MKNKEEGEGGEGTGGFGGLSYSQSCSPYQCCCLALFPSIGQDINCPPILGKVSVLNQYDVTLHVCDAFTMYFPATKATSSHDIIVVHCRGIPM